ncbi:MAG: hypothetical protein JXA30_21630, partial [Deltaproteobacteria bacterium]|nr:hypothetical protein [Deltaproteobacteria bacterium]
RTKRSGRESAKLYVSSGSTEGPKDPSTPARGRWGDSNRIAPGSAPVLRDELAAVVALHRYPPERLRKSYVCALILTVALSCGTEPKRAGGDDPSLLERERQQQAALQASPASSKPRPIYLTRAGLRKPKSALYDAEADLYLVSNVNGLEQTEDNNGFISKVDINGRLIKLRWIEGAAAGVKLSAPKGMAIVDGLLYVVDVGSVRVFDRESGKPQRTIQVKGAAFLNDIAAGPGGVLYLSDTGFERVAAGFRPSGTDAVYRIEETRVTSFYKTAALGFPTGLLADALGVWVANRSGALMRITPGGHKDTEYRLPKGLLDGMVKSNDGRLLVSSWDGRCIYAVQNDGGSVELADGMTSPADIGYDSKRNRLLIPLFHRDQFVIYPL